METSPFDAVIITNSTHPIVTMPHEIKGEELNGWGLSSHGYFGGYPSDSQITIIDAHYGKPVHLVFNYGSGVVIASGLTLEWGYKQEKSRILENTLLYTISDYPTIVHDVAIANVSVSQTDVYAGAVVYITVVASNQGNTTETFKTKVYCNNASIGKHTIVNLAGDKQAVVMLLWNTTGLDPCKTYTIRAEASLILNDVNAQNNVFVYGVVKIRRLGDINGDDRVDIFDVLLAIQAYGSKPEDANWNPFVDLAPKWNVIDICDIVTLTYHYGPRP